ncbi:hypothetical protein ACFSLT_07280 [Novosphingobium resinovorum]
MKQYLATTAATITLLVSASPALADTAAPNDTTTAPGDTESTPGAADNILVSALRTPVAIERVSATVTVLGEPAIVALQPIALTDALLRTPASRCRATADTAPPLLCASAAPMRARP